jgi:hypothetical protein
MAFGQSDFPALLPMPPGFLTNGDRLAGRIGIRAGSGSALPCSVPVWAAG